MASQARGAPGSLPGRRPGRGPDREELEPGAPGALHEARRVAQPWLEEWDSYRLGNLAGTAEQVLERLATYGDLGASYLVAWMPDYPGEETLRRFADEVIPALR